MSQKALNWTVGLGILVCLVGLLFLPSAFGQGGRDDGLLGAGGAILGVGSLIISVAMYFKASAMRSELSQQSQTAQAGRRTKGGCDICHEANPVIQCTMHKQSLCSTCLADHYESRACVYVPSVRKPRLARSVSAGRV